MNEPYVNHALMDRVLEIKQRSENSKHILVEFGEALNDIAVVEKEPKVEGRSMTMFLAEKR